MQITAVRALSLFFFNYTKDDIEKMSNEKWSFIF